MTRLPTETKEKAIGLRRKGYSLKEISHNLGIAKSTASLWVANIRLNSNAKERLRNLGILGQYKTILLREKRRNKLLKNLREESRHNINKIPKNRGLYRTLCSAMFWCEGNKERGNGLRFTNSDPRMISTFMRFLRKGFNVDERKFRALIHLHEYHDGEKQKEFWSGVTKIPKSQFNKCYIKPHTGKRIKEEYQGCVTIYYHDVKIARELWAYYQELQFI